MEEFCTFAEVSPSIGKVRVKHMKKLIALKGTVIRSGGVKMIEFERCYMCRKCKHRFVMHISVFFPICTLNDRPSMGRLVLNSVLDGQLNYIMSALQLPAGAVHTIDKKRRGFLWNGSNDASEAKCLVPWDTVCSPRQSGGLGVKNIQKQNTCLLLKLLHRLYTSTTSSSACWARQQTYP